MDRGEHRRAAFAVAIALFVLGAVECVNLYRAHSWVYRDVRFYLNVNATLVEDLSLEQHRFASSWYNGRLGWNRELPASFSNIALGRNGEHWPMHPYVMPLLATPLYWAFDLHGALLFSLLCAGTIAFCGYRFARAYVGPGSAAVAVAAFLFATGQRDYLYYYSVDSLLCAVFSLLLACIVTGRGWLAGIAFGLSVIIKPTTAMHVPALLLLAIEHRRTLGFLGRGAVTSTAVAGAWGAGNTYMFGAPWRAPYTRVLVVHDGVPQIESDVHAFETPLRVGLKRTWSGDFGLLQSFTVFVLAWPGLAVLAYRRPLYALGAIASAVASLVVFSKFQYEGFRFHFPVFALLLPAFAATTHVAVELGEALLRRARAWVRIDAALAAGLVAATVGIVTLANGGNLERQVGNAPWVEGALALGERGVLDLRDADTAPPPVEPEGSHLTRSRYGQWIARASPAVVALAAPFAAAGGRHGLAVLVVLAVAISAFSFARVAGRTATEPVAAAVALGMIVLARDGFLVSGPGWMALAAALVALDLALESRWVAAGALSVIAAWLADAPWLVLPAVLALALLSGGRTALRALGGAAVPLALWGLGHLWLIGRPFASPDDFVLVQRGAAEATVAVRHRALVKALYDVVGEPGLVRGLAVVGALAVPGMLLVVRRDARAAVAMLALFVTMLVGGTGPARGAQLAAIPPLAVAAVLLPFASFASAAGDLASRAVEWLALRRRAWIAAAVVLASLAAFGAARRAYESAQPWRFESTRAIRHAIVHLGTTPCDFLGWEHMSWECSHHDVGAIGMVGRASQQAIRMGGRAREVLVVPTGTRGMVRSVRWERVPGRRVLRFGWAVPDGEEGGARVTLRVDGRDVATFDTPVQPTGAMSWRDHATPFAAGREVPVEITARSIRTGKRAITVVAGGFVDE